MLFIIGAVVVVYAIARLITLPAFVPRKPDGGPHLAASAWVLVVGLLAAVVVGWLGCELFRVAAPNDVKPDPLGIHYSPPPTLPR